MKKLILLMLAGLLVTGCATQDVKEQDKAAVEQRDLLEAQRKAEEEEARRKSQLSREQEEVNRRLDEERRRAAEEAAKAKSDAEIKALASPSVNASSLDPRSQLKDPGSAVYKRSVYYDFDRYDIREDFAPLVEAHANLLLQNRDLKARIEGNCDERGSTEYNLALGQRRADSVKRALMVLGVPASRIEAVSYGEEKPKATGQDEDSYAENRRSDIMYPGNE